MLKDSEKEILDSLQKGERAALKLLYFNYHSALCQAAYNILKDEDDAKDMVQDVFLNLWINKENLNIQISLFAYLKKAVINTSLNFVEKHKKINKIELEKADLSAHGLNDTEQEENLNELNQKISNAIDLMPSRTRAVFSLIRFEEMSYKEVAIQLQISTKAVEKEMMKALRMLREALKDYLVLILIILMGF